MNGLSSHLPSQATNAMKDRVRQTDRADGGTDPTGSTKDSCLTALHPLGDQPDESNQTPALRDSALLEQLRSGQGQGEALEHLIALYDPVVRYAIFRVTRKQCLSDPAWLDSVASEVWTGLCESVSRSGSHPTSLRAYLVQIARNRAVSAVRRDARLRKHQSTLDVVSEHRTEATSEVDPSDVLGRIEELSALRKCLEGLSAEDRHLVSQLTAITERRWVEAANALGIAESTLRSRWNNVLKRLENCVTGRMGRSFAPEQDSVD